MSSPIRMSVFSSAATQDPKDKGTPGSYYLLEAEEGRVAIGKRRRHKRISQEAILPQNLQ